MNKARTKAKECLFAALFIWVIAGFLSFKIRHPWATETEVAMHFVEALTFKKVDYQEMRPRG